MKTVIVTGGSSGIGKACCNRFLSNGYKVYEISRREQTEQSDIIHISADVTNEESIKEAFKRVFDDEGHIDILVNNAGFGISGSIEFTEVEDAKKQFDVNFFGMFICSKNVIDYMRKNSGGRIVNVSSMAAPLSIPFQGFYSASKAAVNSLTLALANELKPFGIKVCAVMPGDVSTGFTAAREKNNLGEEYYGNILKKSIETMEHDEKNGMTPDSIADAVFTSATKAHPKPLVTKGLQYKTFAIIAKILPTSLVNYLIGKIYA